MVSLKLQILYSFSTEGMKAAVLTGVEMPAGVTIEMTAGMTARMIAGVTARVTAGVTVGMTEVKDMTRGDGAVAVALSKTSNFTFKGIILETYLCP